MAAKSGNGSNVTARFNVDMGALGAEVGPILVRNAASITRRITAQAKANVPVRTGNLGRSIEEDPIRFVGPFRLETGVTAKAHYAGAVHDGYPEKRIFAKGGGVLAFEIGGKKIFAKSVLRPAARARPFLKNAAESVVGSMP